MPPSLNAKERPIFQNVVIAVAGDIGHSEIDIRKWLALRKGTFATEFNKSITHVLATIQQFKSKGAMIKQAMQSKNMKIVTPEWFDQCMHQNKLLPISAFSLRGKKPGGKAPAQTQSKTKAKIQTDEEYVNTDSFHVYSDSTGFKYAITLDGHDGDSFTVELWESEQQPPLYHCAGKYFKQGKGKGIPWRVNATAGIFQREYEWFCAIFLKKTGVKWSDRFNAVSKDGLVKARVKDGCPAYNYQVPAEGRPRGEDDLLAKLQFPLRKLPGGASKAGGSLNSKSNINNGAKSKSVPTTPARAISVDSSDENASPSPATASLPLRPSKDADKMTLTGEESVEHTLRQNRLLPIMSQKRPSLAPDTGVNKLPPPPPKAQKRSSLALPSSNKTNSTAQALTTPLLSQQGSSGPVTPTPARVEGSIMKTPQTSPFGPYTPDKSTVSGSTPTAPKKPETLKAPFRFTLKRPLGATSGTPTGPVQKKLALMRGPVDEDKLRRAAKMANEVKGPEHKPDNSRNNDADTDIIDLDADDEEDEEETSLFLTNDTKQTNAASEKSTAKPSIDLTKGMNDNTAAQAVDLTADNYEVIITGGSHGQGSIFGGPSSTSQTNTFQQQQHQGRNSDKYDALENSIDEDLQAMAEADDMAVDTDICDSFTDSD
ncbi:hypothetical protein G7054_g13733 [Neopestalotiopsis clavispora]|nr:hypothetical protein G7054_g13733 [Neopestalotiopsis clavispora]